jgi:FkbM family methyltransferase
MIVRNKFGRQYVIPNTDVFWKQQLTKGIFQLENIQTLRQLCGNARTIIDVGANVGSNTIEYSTWALQVHSFEPTTELYECLLQNIKTNVHVGMNVNMYKGSSVFTNNIKTYNVALGNIDSEKFIQKHIDNKGRNYVMNGPSNNSEKIIVKTLDSYELTEVDIIKIDTEGYELYVLEGAINTINKYKPVIQTECDDRLFNRYGLTTVDVYKFMSNIGYKKVKQHQHDIFWMPV